MKGSDIPKKAKLAVSVLLIIGGLLVYWIWAITYNAWNPIQPEFIGVYAISSIMILFGILGLLLAKRT